MSENGRRDVRTVFTVSASSPRRDRVRSDIFRRSFERSKPVKHRIPPDRIGIDRGYNRDPAEYIVGTARVRRRAETTRRYLFTFIVPINDKDSSRLFQPDRNCLYQTETLRLSSGPATATILSRSLLRSRSIELIQRVGSARELAIASRLLPSGFFLPLFSIDRRGTRICARSRSPRARRVSIFSEPRDSSVRCTDHA